MTEQTSNSTAIIKYMRSEAVIERFRDVLGPAASAFISSVLVAVANNTDLQDCTKESVYTSAIRAASLKLSCDPATGQAYLVPFNSKKGKVCTFVPGYKGYQQLALRTQRYRFMNAFALYEGEILIEDKMRGVFKLGGAKKTEVVIGYGHYFEMFDGFGHALYMTVEQIEEHARRYSKNYHSDSSLWKKDFPAMAKKTVTRLNLMRHGYLNPTDQMILTAVDENENDAGLIIEGEAAPVVDDLPVTPEPPRPAQQVMSDLGFDDPTVYDTEFTAQHEAEPVPAKMSLDFAEDMKSSEGKRYGDIPTDILAHMANTMRKGLDAGKYTNGKLEEVQMKLDAIAVILDNQQAS